MEKPEVTSLCLSDLLKLPSSFSSTPLTLLGKLVYEDQGNLQGTSCHAYMFVHYDHIEIYSSFTSVANLTVFDAI